MQSEEPHPPRIPPTPVVKAAFSIRNRLRRGTDALLPPQGITAERTFLLAEIKLLGVVCELGIPEAIDGGARTPAAIGATVGAEPDPTERVLRFLASRGWFKRARDGSYRLNRRSRALRRDDPESLKDWVSFMAADWHWNMWNNVTETVRTGTSAARVTTGKTFFDWVHDERPDAGATFDGAMHSLSSVAGPLVVGAVDVEGVHSVCDVGGGTGRLLRSLLEAHGQLRGTVVDLTTVVAGAPDVLGSLPESRWQAIGGSFFDRGVIPGEHDRYLMQAILHDWGDDQAGTILDNVRAAMPSGAKVWVVDSILVPGERDDLAKPIDVLMLTLTEGGRERSEPEWERLFAAHGFRVEHRVQLPLLIWVQTLVAA